MKKRWFIALAGTAALGAVLAALPAQSRASSSDDRDRIIRDVIVHRNVLPRLRALAIQDPDARTRIQEALALAEQGQTFWFDEDSGWLGVSLDEVSAEKAKEAKLPTVRGVLVTDVEPDSPAAKAGLKSGDIITDFNGQRVEGVTQFRRYIRETPAGRTAQLSVWRDGRSQNLSVELAAVRGYARTPRVQVYPPDFKFEMPEIQIPKFDILSSRTPLIGISAEDLSGQLGEYFGAPGGEGVLVREVRSGSPAEKAGMKAGDVITKVDGSRVTDLEEFRSMMRDKRDKNSVAITVLRRGSESTLNVEIERPKPPTERKRLTYRTST